MTGNLLITDRSRRILAQNIQRWRHRCHLFSYRIAPKRCPRFFIDLQRTLHRMRQFKAKLLLTPHVTRLRRFNNPITSTQCRRNPPLKSRLKNKLVSSSILSSLHRVRLFHVLQRNPTRTSVLPSNAKFPTTRRTLRHQSTFITFNKTFIRIHRIGAALVVNNFVKQCVRKPLVINLLKHIFRDHICRISTDLSIIKLNFI